MSLRYAVLGIIQKKPLHGYEIKQAIEDTYGDIWNVSFGQLYPTLKNLSEKGLVTKHKEQGQKSLAKNVYAITESGKKDFDKWLLDVPKKINISGKDEFALLYLYLFLEGSQIQSLEAVKRQRVYFQKQKEKFQQLLSRSNVKNQAETILVKRILHRIDAELCWLDDLDDTNTV